MKKLPFKSGDVVIYITDENYDENNLMIVEFCGTGKEMSKLYSGCPEDSEDIVVWLRDVKGRRRSGWDFAEDVVLFELATSPLWKALE